MKKFNIMAVLLLFSISVLAIVPPDNVQATFKKMYPKTNDIAWSQDDGYYCANFVMNGFTKNVWFNAQGQWEMTQTDLVSLDRLTPVVYNAFTFSSYASWVAEDVTMVEFPLHYQNCLWRSKSLNLLNLLFPYLIYYFCHCL